ncbi:hypothetical protein LJC37_06015 [Bacteroidales bacterium OttesenSCG-928-E04]|nr:hypothetical protein [Bacteroidales bacterium OttesenSCG-928-E04]
MNLNGRSHNSKAYSATATAWYDRDRNKNKSNFIKTINEVNIYFEVFNLIGTSNIASHTWVSDISSQMIPVPNYLTGRLINLKFAISI